VVPHVTSTVTPVIAAATGEAMKTATFERGRLLRNGTRVLVHGALIEGIDFRSVGLTARSDDFVRDLSSFFQPPRRQKDSRTSLGKGFPDRASERITDAVDHRVLVGEQHTLQGTPAAGGRKLRFASRCHDTALAASTRAGAFTEIEQDRSGINLR
jgi:hypothetical protein